MDSAQPVLKKLAVISLSGMFVLFILGAVFYKERILFSDASFVFFTILDQHRLFFPSGRYGVFITEIFPYFGQKMGLPLSTLIFLYGMSFYLVYLAAASVVFFWLKQYRLVILMTLFYFLFVSQVFGHLYLLNFSLLFKLIYIDLILMLIRNWCKGDF